MEDLKVKVELNRNQLTNLYIFLDRAEYKGVQEANALVEIMELLGQAAQEAELEMQKKVATKDKK